jgi:hypothetical protein
MADNFIKDDRYFSVGKTTSGALPAKRNDAESAVADLSQSIKSAAQEYGRPTAPRIVVKKFVIKK